MQEPPPNRSLEGFINQTLYDFSRHYWWGWTLTRWLVFTLISFPLIVLVSGLPGQIPLAIGLGVIVLGIIFYIRRVIKRNFLRFQPQPNLLSTDIIPSPLNPTIKIPLTASGIFRVGHKKSYYVLEATQYQTFETRERVIMVNIPHTRLFSLAKSKQQEVGWWYAFFSPKTLHTVTAGILHVGKTPQPTLCLTYDPRDEAVKGLEMLYLSFTSIDDLHQIVADLKFDGVVLD